ncbi:hypothetical protein NLJ89_g1450 [Agrocybe chaxingu]|uniref:Uncharacterized protein n=1 Tax=Agrocybe chaxingu TaxID=84603 RepID=A0A9W8N031_9AGAR|nr:hypothetical protein NLJ89_g1450 [Agrocybe chaxingu]
MAWSSRLVQWLSNIWIILSGLVLSWASSLVRPFKSSPVLELPTRSPSLPSTPSFIQSFEPNPAWDAMKIFQLSNGSPRASRVARNKIALQEARHGVANGKSFPSPPLAYPSSREDLKAPYRVQGSHMSTSTSPSDKSSPGFSIFSDITHTLAPATAADSPSLYSSTATSPASTLNALSTPGSDVLYIGPKEELLQGEMAVKGEHEDGLAPPILSPFQKEACVSKIDDSFSVNFKPDIGELSKRRAFMGRPIVTALPHEHIFLPYRSSNTSTDEQNLPPPASPIPSTPKSAFSTLTDLVRSPSPLRSPKVIKRRPTPAVSISEPTYDQPFFGTQGESYFADDDLALPASTVDIHDLDVYRHSNVSAQSTLSGPSSPKPSPTLRRKARHLDLGALASPFDLHFHGTNVYDSAIYSLSQDGTSVLELRDSTVDSPTLSLACVDLISESRVISVVSSLGPIEEEESGGFSDDVACISCVSGSAASLSLQKPEANMPSPLSANESQMVQPTTAEPEAEEELKRLSKRLSDYASMVFPFSLDDVPSTASGSDYDSDDSEKGCDEEVNGSPLSLSLNFPEARDEQASTVNLVPASHAAVDIDSVIGSSGAETSSCALTVDSILQVPSPSGRLTDPATEAFKHEPKPSQATTDHEVSIGGISCISGDAMSPQANVPTFSDVIPFQTQLPPPTADEISAVPVPTKGANRKRNRSATIFQSIPVSASHIGLSASVSDPSHISLVGVFHPISALPPAETSDTSCLVAAHTTGTVGPPAHSSILGFSASFSCPSALVSMEQDPSAAICAGEHVSLEADGVPSVPPNFHAPCKQDVDLRDAKIRARRAGVYGGLSRQNFSAPLDATPRRLDSIAARSRSVAPERHRSSIIYSSQRLGRCGSSLRPLVLPLRIALRESVSLSTGEVADDSNPGLAVRSGSFGRKEHGRTSIGLPPAFPLPSLPMRAVLRRKAPPEQPIQVSGRKERTEDRVHALIALIDAMDVASVPATDSESEPSTPATPAAVADPSPPEPVPCGLPPDENTKVRHVP